MDARIIALEAVPAPQREEAAALLLNAFAHAPWAWPDLPAAREEVATFLGNPDRLGFAALDGRRLAGWIGGIRHSRFTWELHPLVVDPSLQRLGYGTALVDALEGAARDAGVGTIWLGTDDDVGGTNLFGRDLYPDVLEHLMDLAPAAGHPYTFYLSRGYTVVGVLPDAGGFGRPDIVMAKRIGPAD